MNRYLTDTNIIIRLVTKDDPEQIEQLVEFVENNNAILFVEDTVLIECCWVLKSRYKFSQKEISTALELLLDNENFEFDNYQIARRILIDFAGFNVSPVDAYIAAKSRRYNIPVLSWDKGFSKLNCEWYSPSQ